MIIALGAAGSALAGVSAVVALAVAPAGRVLTNSGVTGAGPEVLAARISGRTVALAESAARGCSSAMQAAVNEARSTAQAMVSFKKGSSPLLELPAKAFPERFSGR